MAHQHQWKFQVSLFVELPAEAFHHVNKGQLRLKATKILGAGWDRVTIAYCDCGKATKDLSVLCKGK